MLYALIDNEKITASPNTTGHCPLCESEMIAKCGQIKIWHWAHKNLTDCDDWHEGETDWHLRWKSLFPPSWTEVVITKEDKKHRADVLTPDGTVLEFQHSPISLDDIEKREQFYNDMIWIFDIADCRKPEISYSRRGKEIISHRFSLTNMGRYYNFKWKWPRKHIAETTRERYLDLGDGRLFNPLKMYRSGKGGWGYMYSIRELLPKMGIPSPMVQTPHMQQILSEMIIHNGV